MAQALHTDVQQSISDIADGVALIHAEVSGGPVAFTARSL